MPELHHVFLVPGFFGFANIGELLYFSHVRQYLREACYRQHLPVEIHTVQTHPTASLRRRAERLLEVVLEEAGHDEHPIHLIGHSSGALDARLMVSPGVSLRTDIDVEGLAARVRSVVMLSAPNHGTPVASFFTSLFGQKLLFHGSDLAGVGLSHQTRQVLFDLLRRGALVEPGDDLLEGRNALRAIVDQFAHDLSSLAKAGIVRGRPEPTAPAQF